MSGDAGAQPTWAKLAFKSRTEKKDAAGRPLLSTDLDHLMYQFFVDCVGPLKCRATTTLLMQEARRLRADLIRCGSPPTHLPKLGGSAGRMWFKRWRDRYSISARSLVAQPKISWAKMRRRVSVLWSNIFRLRFLWEKCHGHTANMRWISWDQKPSWFNNMAAVKTHAFAGNKACVKELFSQSRQRYSICTCVDSKARSQHEEPPPVAVLFKAQPGGRVLQDVIQICNPPGWLCACSLPYAT